MEAYRTNNVLILWGDDFAHKKADLTFDALDTTLSSIKTHLNDQKEGEHPEYHLRYSSMNSYLGDVFTETQEKRIKWSQETKDFWAYNYLSVPDAYWTGYFTTHPDFKGKASLFSDFA